MVDHVKFVMHFKSFMACCNIIGWWIMDGWVPLQNIGARAGGPQDWCTPDTVCRNGAQTRQTGFTILCYSATIYQWMSAVSEIVFQSLTVAAIRGSRLKLLLWIFCVTKFTQNFLQRHLKENDMFKILAACHSMGPFLAGGPTHVCTVPMVNPAMMIRVQDLNPNSTTRICCGFVVDLPWTQTFANRFDLVL